MRFTKFAATNMFSLLLGLLLFIGLHLTLEFGLRPLLIDCCGSENAYKGAYSLLALIGLGLIVWGKASAPFIMLWQPKFELRSVSHMLMIPAVILVIAGNTPMSYIRHHLRNPMLAGVTLWGLAHLWSNGDLASVLLFGTMTIWAGFKFLYLGLKNTSRIGQGSPAVFRDIIALCSGPIIYTLISRYHGEMFGVGLDFV
jgi:uncharacterized membrane protein